MKICSSCGVIIVVGGQDKLLVFNDEIKTLITLVLKKMLIFWLLV